MTKQRIRIFDTIGYGFFFAASHYGSLLRLTWLPALIALVIFNTQTTVQLMARRGELPSLGFLPEYTAMFAWLPIYLLLAIPAVAAYRMAVFGHKAPGGLAYFRLGGTELQFLAAQLVTSVYMIVYLLLAMTVIIPAGLGTHQLLTSGAEAAQASGFADLIGPALGDDVTLWVRIGIGVSLATGLAYLFGLVLFSQVQPVVVVERHIGVLRSLRLLWLGNAVRLSVVWFVAGTTLAAVTGALYSLAGQFIPTLLFRVFPTYNDSILWHVLLMFNAVTIIPSIMIGTLVLGVTAGVNGFAYRQMVMGPPKRPSHTGVDITGESEESGNPETPETPETPENPRAGQAEGQAV